VFSWNINGIEPFLPPSSLKITSFFTPSNPSAPKPVSESETSGLRAFLSRHGWPEVLFLQELKIKQGDSKTLAALSSSLNTQLESNANDTLADNHTYILNTVLPRDKHNARGFQGKLYGVGTILRTDFARDHVARVRHVDWDLEGRVSIVEMRPSSGCAKSKPLALINVYAVNGTLAPYRSPEDGQIVGTRHDHKLAFHSRLRDECLALEARSFHVVVAGDLNVARGVLDGHPNLRSFPKQHCINRADFNAKFFGEEDNRRAQTYMDGRADKCLDAVDVFRAMHGAERRYTYYPRSRDWGSSCDRVDLIFVSKGLWEAGRVAQTGILNTPQERGLSDHVPLWVDVAMDEMPDGNFTL
jgi:exonuclease III